MATLNRQPARYASVRDLPSFIEMEGYRDLLESVSPSRRDLQVQVSELEDQMASVAETVDDFYRILGPRNWLFTDTLSLRDVDWLTKSHKDDPADAERALIQHQDDTLDVAVLRLAQRAGLRERFHLIETALADYQVARYPGMIHLLISVMDGFVNDVTRQDPRRRGLHAQSGEDMEAWDSVVSHTQGLARVHEEIFSKPFYNLVSDEVTELYRNGIVHGTVVNFGNKIVAAKAWNYLFAVVDWATAREKVAVEPTEQSTWREIRADLGDIEETRTHVDAWEPRVLGPSDPGFEADSVHRRVVEFFGLWRQRNWGHISELTTRRVGAAAIATPREIKQEYSPLVLESWEIREVRHEAPAIATVDCAISVAGDVHRATLRWVHESEEGSVRAETQDGEWWLVSWGPAGFLDRPVDR